MVCDIRVYPRTRQNLGCSQRMEYVIIFIIISHHIYLLLYSNSDKNYIQTITSVKFLLGMPPNNSKNINK